MSHPESTSDPYAAPTPPATPTEPAAPVFQEPAAPVIEQPAAPAIEQPAAPAAPPAAPVFAEPPAAPEPTAVLPAPAPPAPVAPTAQLPAYSAGPAYPAPAGPAVPAYQAGQAPVSGPAYPVASGVPYPTSSFPASGLPAQPAPAKRGRTAVIVLSVLSGLLVLGLIGMTALFVISAGDAKKKQDTLTAQLNAANRELSNAKLDLQTKASDLSKMQQDLDGSKAATTEQTRQKEAVGKCLDLIYKVLAANTLSDFNKRLKAADKPCDEADKYVDSF